MKLKLLFLSLLGAVTIANAQYTVKDNHGNVLQDGDVIEFGTTSYPDAEYQFFVTNNNPSQTIYSRIEYISETNAQDPNFEQLCYGTQCYFSIGLGTTVPPQADLAAIIPVGETTGIGNHLYSDDPGNGVDNVDFVFSFKQYESETSMVEIGTPLTFTYRYNPSLGVNEINQVNLSIQSTVVKDQLVLKISEPVQMVMYDIQGKMVKQARFESGNQNVNVSDLSAGTYIVQFKNNGGALKTTKILVQ